MAIDVSTTLVRPYQLTNAVTESGETLLSDAISDYETARTSAGRTFLCPKCRGIGTHAKSLDTNNPADTNQIQCTLVVGSVICDGWGYNIAAVKAKFVNQFELV